MLERDAPILSAVVRAEKRGDQWRRLVTPLRRFVPDRWAQGGVGAPDVRTAAVARCAGRYPFLPEIPDMSPLPTACLAIALLAATATAHAQDASRTHYVMLVNRAHDSVTKLSVADPGSGAFRDVAVDRLRGGGDSATVGIHGAGCRYDMRFAFDDGRTLVYQDLDVCHYGLVRIRPLPRKGVDAATQFTVSMAR
ncbi:hypothetical protein KHF85_05355 [Xanthomonas translucens pv. graminis]|uniref:hypothetical protein n=1 Tax=Xanthomonas graminis TaxID=3390026 RepID=UPI002540C1EC|nr:hypothetical protein [Xanthomonas translucens]WIH05891.1 hypothetical protein KHF85_05355 [Xanthomonas translucens pv. graminis]